MDTDKTPGFEGWAVLELMGHRKLAGKVTEAEIAGKGFIRLDVPGEEGTLATQFYSPGSLYCLTPVTEAVARALAKRYQPEPVSRYELPQLTEAPPKADRDAELVDGGRYDDPGF